MTFEDAYLMILVIGGIAVSVIGARLGYILYEEYKLEKSLNENSRIKADLENERASLEQDIKLELEKSAKLQQEYINNVREAEKVFESNEVSITNTDEDERASLEQDINQASITDTDNVDSKTLADTTISENNNNAPEIIDQNFSSIKNYHTFTLFGRPATEDAKPEIPASLALSTNHYDDSHSPRANMSSDAKLEETFAERVSGQSLEETVAQTIIWQEQLLADQDALQARLNKLTKGY